MLIFIAGYPGPAAIWTAHMVRDLCAQKGSAEIIFAGTQAELTGALVRSRAEWSVVHMPHPGNRMIAALRESGQALILVRDDPRHTLMVFLEQWKTPLPDAIRAIAAGAAAARDMSAVPGALYIEAQCVTGATQDTIARLKHHLGVGDRDGQLPECPPALSQPWNALWQALGPGDRSLAEDALAGFCTIRWGAALFKGGPLLDAPLLDPVDITGRARILLQGPFINLPEGRWHATIRLGISGSAAHQEFLLEGHAGQILITAVVRPDHAGEHLVEFNFIIDGATDAPFFLRLSTTRASFDGEIMLHDATLIQVHPGEVA